MDDNERIKALEHELELLKQKRDLLKQIDELESKLGMVKERVIKEYVPYYPAYPTYPPWQPYITWSNTTLDVPINGTITVSGSNDTITDATYIYNTDTPFTWTRSNG